MLGLLLILISKSWRCPPPPRVGHAFPGRHNMRKGGVLFISARVFLLYGSHPWTDDRTDGWMDGSCEKLHKKRP